MSIRNQPSDAAVFGIDIGKTVFHVVGLDAAHAPMQKATFSRSMRLQAVVLSMIQRFDANASLESGLKIAQNSVKICN